MQSSINIMSFNVFDLACALSSNPSATFKAFTRMYKVSLGSAQAKTGAALAEKYGVPQDGSQIVVAITNKVTGDQTWYNPQRSMKPQTFKGHENAVQDPFEDPSTECDFCQWQTFTAEDTFGRFENGSAVTASNLFKFCQPCHGLALFKHHNPLSFTEEHIHDLLLVSHQWLLAAQQRHPDAKHPAFIWNCLARSGASQFHGHAQLLLSQEPLPTVHVWQHAWDLMEPNSAGRYWHELLLAHRSVGLLTTIEDISVSHTGDRVFVYPSLTPVKDQEVVILGNAMDSKSFSGALHGVLRTLIDDLGSQTFNVIIFGMDTAPKVETAADTRISEPEHGRVAPKSESAEEVLEVANPVVARIVVRGAVNAKASDFGALEVLCGASIGRTDPYRIHEALQHRFA